MDSLKRPVCTCTLPHAAIKHPKKQQEEYTLYYLVNNLKITDFWGLLLTVYKNGQNERASKGVPGHLDCPLVANDSIGHKHLSLHVSRQDMGKTKNTKYSFRYLHFSFFDNLMLWEEGETFIFWLKRTSPVHDGLFSYKSMVSPAGPIRKSHCGKHFASSFQLSFRSWKLDG